ncbi:hypothetical protein PYCCODRAFT_1469615 [Trametes coccinea BRFM310]|uniref:Uncharacterized protein n=1 Tax=Trametes coccinea (strain BRFM310) TaxID=1353009 RepID=A0A1Y2IGG9_TRAC3|nr:hypothetical protein PYCCODRAFT_1469615 [Trametes coccinea BRFM310]
MLTTDLRLVSLDLAYRDYSPQTLVEKRAPPGTASDRQDPLYALDSYATARASESKGPPPVRRFQEAAAESMDINHYMQTETPAPVQPTPPTGGTLSWSEGREDDSTKRDDRLQHQVREVDTTTAERAPARNGVSLPDATDAATSIRASQHDVPSSARSHTSALGQDEKNVSACPPPTDAGVSRSLDGLDGEHPANSNASTISPLDHDSGRTSERDYGRPSSLTSPEPVARPQPRNGDIEHADIGDRRREVRLGYLEARVEELMANLDVVRFELEMLRMGE